MRWDRFSQKVRFRRGQHITIVGTTGSGKTVLAREILQNRDYTMVAGTKKHDEELYPAFEELGFELTDDFDAGPEPENSRVIFRPERSDPGTKGRNEQREAFERALFEVWEVGRWTVYADEVWWLTDRLRLAPMFEEFWAAGRSDKITVVASTQKPVDIPLLAFDGATHLFLFRNSDRYRINRMAEFTGRWIEVARWLIPQLPEHEFLYVNTRTAEAYRSKVLLR